MNSGISHFLSNAEVEHRPFFSDFYRVRPRRVPVRTRLHAQLCLFSKSCRYMSTLSILMAVQRYWMKNGLGVRQLGWHCFSLIKVVGDNEYISNSSLVSKHRYVRMFDYLNWKQTLRSIYTCSRVLLKHKCYIKQVYYAMNVTSYRISRT